jgi:hypothetical protein
MAVAVVVIADDFTALSVVLPAIEKDFHSEIGTAGGGRCLRVFGLSS